jgi:hypothetical protein
MAARTPRFSVARWSATLRCSPAPRERRPEHPGEQAYGVGSAEVHTQPLHIQPGPTQEHLPVARLIEIDHREHHGDEDRTRQSRPEAAQQPRPPRAPSGRNH